MGTIFRNESPLNVPSSTEFRSDPFSLLQGQKLVEFLEFTIGTNEVRSIIAPNERWVTTASDKLLQGCDEGFSRQFRHNLQRNCFHCEGHENAEICFRSGGLLNHAILNMKGTGIVHSNFLKHRSRRHTLKQ